MNVPQYIGNSIAIWHIVQDNLHGIVPVKKEAYTLLSPTLKAEEKIRILTQDFHIFMEKEEKKEVNQMCNLSEAIVEEGIRQGLSQGITQGITQGIAQGIHAFIRCCFDSGNQEEEILEKLKKYFSLDDASASEALQRFLSGNLAG